MAKVLVVTSGKGGVGKTTSTAALGAALAQSGAKVVVVDFDVGLRNLDLIMGAERRVVFDLINVVQGVAKLPQALIRDKRLENLWLLPASQTRDKDALTEEGVGKVIDDLRTKFDWILCDSPAGIERGATLAMRYADEAVIVTNPEVSSVRDSDRIIGMLEFKDGEGGERRAGTQAYPDHPLRRIARGTGRDAHHRRYSRNSRDPAAGHYSGEPGCAEGIQRRHSGHAEQCRRCAGASLYRCGQASFRRDSRHERAIRAQGIHGQAVATEGGMSMGLLRLLSRRKTSAPVARERLQILLAHERGLRGQPDLLGLLREEILAVVSKHVKLDPDKVTVRLDRGEDVSTLEVDIEVPNGFEKQRAAAG